MTWAIYFTPAALGAVGVSVLLYRAHADWWHWGTVAAVSFALLCEVWYGYCQHSSSVTKEVRRRTSEEKLNLLFFERPFTSPIRTVVESGSTGGKEYARMGFRSTSRMNNRALIRAPLNPRHGTFRTLA